MASITLQPFSFICMQSLKSHSYFWNSKNVSFNLSLSILFKSNAENPGVSTKNILPILYISVCLVVWTPRFKASLIGFVSRFNLLSNLFNKLYKLLLGTKNGHNVIEIAYSIGIGLGIILFFNHFSRKKLQKDLTPIQIEMRTYEQDMNTAFIKDAEREGKTKDI